MRSLIRQTHLKDKLDRNARLSLTIEVVSKTFFSLARFFNGHLHVLACFKLCDFPHKQYRANVSDNCVQKCNFLLKYGSIYLTVNLSDCGCTASLWLASC